MDVISALHILCLFQINKCVFGHRLTNLVVEGGVRASFGYKEPYPYLDLCWFTPS